ncbi:integral membrane protein [Mycolicibacterium cosmeticum]|uniref:Integral membrane protein n=1 Tax=Mycolicibacterium cosmeticum TaxID=258533 RepID=W9AV65_MYCCO|nr:integral membrane protein [Mycolicibacterium cosmeticum]
MGVNLLGRKKDNPQPEDADASAPASATAAGDTGLTAPKGRPTPKRSEASRKRGPVAPAPLTTAEARKRRKELAASKPKLSREERKAEKVARRAAMTERRERMMAGDDAYLLPRDKGPVRRYARDIVDSRRNLLGLFMPVALALVLITLAVPAVEVQRWVSYGMPVLLVVMAIDGVLVGRRVNRMVDAKFPSNTESGFKLGFYAASRASQLRRMRAPRPMVNRGDDV